MDIKKLLILSLLISVPFEEVAAVKMRDLYRVEVPLPAQTDDFKAMAVKDGLDQVLLRITGNPFLNKKPIVRDALKKADYYVKEIYYEPPSTSSSQYFVKIAYDDKDIKRLLNKAGIKLWGENRPLVLVWLVSTNRNDVSEIVGEESQNHLLTVMKNVGTRFGVPLIFPMMDMTDLNKVTVEDVTVDAIPLLREASVRYSPDALLIGNIESGGTVDSEWRLVIGNYQWDYNISDKLAENVMATLLTQITPQLRSGASSKPLTTDESSHV